MNSTRARRQLSISPARRLAFEILLDVQKGGYSTDLLALNVDRLQAREDKNLARELVLGVLRRQSSLDYFIELYTKRSVSRLDAAVVIALRLGLYQIRYLERIPDSAAVNESVNIVKIARLASVAGLVNAVLRKAASDREHKPGQTITDAAQRRAIEFSHPEWLIARWASWLGDDEAARLAQANNERAGVSFRVNEHSGRKYDEILDGLRNEGLSMGESAYVPGAWIFESGDSAVLQNAMSRGDIYIQDEASQLVSILVGPQPGERILDLCAAPGSKATHLASLARNSAWIVAGDLNPRRLATLTEISGRLSVRTIDAIAMDGTQGLPFRDGEMFDRVLVDAPCTGTGTLRRNPEIKWRISPDDSARLSDVQSKLLERASQALRRGGRLVYSTCSLEPEENETVVEHFLETTQGFKQVIPMVHSDLITASGAIRTFPYRHNMDGFFAAVLERIK